MEGISDEVLEVARNLFDGGDIDYNIDRYGKATVNTEELPDLDNYEYTYGTTRAEILQQAIDLIVKILPNVTFYNDYNDTGIYLELSDNHTFWDINEPEGFDGEFDYDLYNFFVEQAFDEFENQTGVELYQCGRSGRHICVEVNFDNILNYDNLCKTQAELEQQVIGEAESNCFGQALEEAKELAPDEKVAKCLSCGMKIKYKNRDVQHDAMGDYIECPNCHSTFDVDYDNTPTKKTEDLSPAEEIDLADDINTYLMKNQLYPVDVFAADTRVMVEIEWGDWKHDHLRCDALMKAKGYTLVEEEVTEEDGSDCFSAIRHYEPKDKFKDIKTEAEDYSVFKPAGKVLSGNKGLSEKEIAEIRRSLPNLFKDMTDEQKQIWEELSLRGMVMSCLIYGEDIHTSTVINAVSKYYKQPYVNEYYDTLGKDVTEEIIKQQTEYFNKGKVIKDVGTDSDGLSYNSFVEPKDESKKVTEAEDMTQVKDDIETAVEKSESTEQEIEQVKGSLEVLKTDEEEAIAGYDTFVDNSAKVVDDELADAIDDEMQEIIQDEKDHIEKLDTIKSTLGENKKTEASVTKFQTLTVDKDGNEMLLKDTSYNHACSWLEKELAKAGSKVVDTETKGNKTIIKADNKTKFEYDEEKGTLKRLEEAKRSNKQLDYKLDGFKGVTISVVDKKNGIDTEDYFEFDSMEFGIDEYEFKDSMVDGIKDVLTNLYEFSDVYYDDVFTEDEIDEMAEDITQDVLQLYDDLPEENIDREKGIANLDESKEAPRLTGDETYVARNSSGYKSIGLIVNNETKQFQIINGQVMTTDSKTKKMSKKQIRDKAQQLYDNGYTEYDGYGSVAQGVEKKTEAKVNKSLNIDRLDTDPQGELTDYLWALYDSVDDSTEEGYNTFKTGLDKVVNTVKDVLGNTLYVHEEVEDDFTYYSYKGADKISIDVEYYEQIGPFMFYIPKELNEGKKAESKTMKKENKQNITEDTTSSEFNLYIKPEELADVNISSLLFDSNTVIADYKEGNYMLSLIVRGDVKIYDNETGYAYKNYQDFPVDLQSLIKSGALGSGDDTNKYTVDMNNWFEWFLDEVEGDAADTIWYDVADIEGMLNKATPEENETELEIIMKDLFDDIVGQLNESKEVKTETVKIMAYGKLYYEYSNDEWNSKSEDEKNATIIDVADQATEEEGHTVYEDEVEVITENRKVTEAKDDLEGIKNLIVYEKTQDIFEELYHNEHLDCEYNGSDGVVKITSADEQTFNIIDEVMVDKLHYSKLSNYVYELNEGPIYRDIKGGFDFKGYSYKVDVKFSLNEKDTVVGTVGISKIDVKKENKNLTEDITSKDVDEIFSKYAETPVTVKNLKQKWASASDEMHGVIAGGWSAIITGNNFKIKVVNSLKLSGYKISGENIEEAEKAARKIYINATDIGYNTGLYESKEVKTEKIESKEVKMEVKNMNDIIDRLYSGDKVYFKDTTGYFADINQYYVCEKSLDYPKDPNDYDEGYTSGWNIGNDTAYDKEQERKYQRAKKASEDGDVWEFDEVDENGEYVGVVATICYGKDELQYILDEANLTPVNQVKKFTEKMGKDADKKYSNLYKYKGKAFAYDNENAIVEYVYVDPEDNSWIVLDEIGLSNDNWDNKEARDEYLDEYIAQLDDEANRLADDFIANEYLGESLASRYVKTENKSIKTEASEGTATLDAHTDLLPIINMYQYDLYNMCDDLVPPPNSDMSKDVDEAMLDIAEPIIETEIKGVLPSAKITFKEYEHPKYYKLFSNLNDVLYFDITYNVAEYEALKEKAIKDPEFEQYLKDHYKSYDGFMSFFADNLTAFNQQEEWKQFVSVLSYYLPNDDEQNYNTLLSDTYDKLLEMGYEPVDSIVDGLVDNITDRANDGEMTLNKDTVTQYIKELYGDVDQYDYILDEVLNGLSLSESKKTEAKGESERGYITGEVEAIIDGMTDLDKSKITGKLIDDVVDIVSDGDVSVDSPEFDERVTSVVLNMLDESKKVTEAEVATATKSAGEYWVGDPCYVVPDDIYQGIWGDKYKFKDGIIDCGNGLSFQVHGTAWGDGEYKGSNGFIYGVDAGVLAIVPMELATKERGLDKGTRHKSSTAKLKYKDGIFNMIFDNETITINTDPSEDLDESKQLKKEDYEVRQDYYDPETGEAVRNEYVMSFDTWEEAQRFADGLAQDPNCTAWVNDTSKDESKKIEDKELLTENDEIPVVNPDEQDYYNNKGYIISLYPRSRSNVSII